MYGFPESLTQPGMGEDERTDKFLLDQMHALAIAIAQAKERGDTVGVANLQAAFRKLEQEYRARSGDYLTTTDKLILKTGQYAEDVVTALPRAIAALPKAAASGIFQAMLPFALMYGAFVWFTRRRK
jgi:hypothetical protein